MAGGGIGELAAISALVGTTATAATQVASIQATKNKVAREHELSAAEQAASTAVADQQQQDDLRRSLARQKAALAANGISATSGSADRVTEQQLADARQAELGTLTGLRLKRLQRDASSLGQLPTVLGSLGQISGTLSTLNVS